MTIPGQSVVVVGSLDRADDYQRVLSELKASGATVSGEMLDRILDNGEYGRGAGAFYPASFTKCSAAADRQQLPSPRLHSACMSSSPSPCRLLL